MRISGCTVHFVTPELDSGPIIAQAAVPVLAGDTPDTLAERILVAEHRLYPFALRLVASGQARLEGGRVLLKDGGLTREISYSRQWHRPFVQGHVTPPEKTPRQALRIWTGRRSECYLLANQRSEIIQFRQRVDPREGWEEARAGGLRCCAPCVRGRQL